jgi:hypothetical protein
VEGLSFPIVGSLLDFMSRFFELARIEIDIAEDLATVEPPTQRHGL